MGNTGSYSAEVSTAIPAGVCSAPDGYEAPGNDNSPGASTPILPGGSQVHNFCNPAGSSNGLNDEDWLVIPVQAGKRYRFLAFPQVESAAAALRLYAQDGETLLGQASAAGFGQVAALDWTAGEEGLLFLQVRPLDGGVAGNAQLYLVAAREDYEVFIPALRR
jgi:hypothetical protein